MNRRVLNALRCVLAWAMLPPCAIAQTPAPPTQNVLPPVLVFAVATTPLRNVGTAKIVYLDAISNFDQALSQGLPSDEAQAKAVLQQRLGKLNGVNGNGVKNLLSEASVGLMHGFQLRIDRVPAVVFQGRAVIYGVADVAEANAIYQQWQAAQR
jgi:integrating conjugative element protein (TIGR03757 family)